MKPSKQEYTHRRLWACVCTVIIHGATREIRFSLQAKSAREAREKATTECYDVASEVIECIVSVIR